MFNDFKKLTQIRYLNERTFNVAGFVSLTKENLMQQVLFHFSKSTGSIKAFSYNKKPPATFLEWQSLIHEFKLVFKN